LKIIYKIEKLDSKAIAAKELSFFYLGKELFPKEKNKE